MIQNFCFGHHSQSHLVKIYVAIVSRLETAMNNTELQLNGQEIHISIQLKNTYQQWQKKMVSALVGKYTI